MNKKASFKKSFGLLFFSIALILIFRWALFEPFVIPSGSMIPTLLINDHILVAKSSYGLRVPFSSDWLIKPNLPKRGDVVVFRSVEKSNFYLIKRVIGLPGDKVQFTAEGELIINGEVVLKQTLQTLPADKMPGFQHSGQNFQIFEQKMGDHEHFSMLEKGSFRYTEPGRVVPEGKIYLMGDNRDHSQDSRFWGEAPVENLLGRALFVWLSCSETLSRANFICDPRYIRWQRFFHRIQ